LYVLSTELDAPDANASGAFKRYQAFIAENRERFPSRALELATSTWFYDSRDHRCPHDAWLEAAAIEEPAEGERRERRTVAMRIRLLGAYHDGHIELYYPRVFRYQMDLYDGTSGHHDWRYDEFRLTAENRLIHEIEWWAAGDTARWIIEASDVHFAWHPARQ
jgi:hypothetical protein